MPRRKKKWLVGIFQNKNPHRNDCYEPMTIRWELQPPRGIKSLEVSLTFGDFMCIRHEPLALARPSAARENTKRAQ